MRRSSILPGLLCMGCSAASPLGAGASLPPERTQECVSACEGLGLQMSAVVVISNSVGCVCEPGGANSRTSRNGAAVAAGVLLADQQRQR